MLQGRPVDAPAVPVRFSDLPAQSTLTSAQVVDLVLAAVVACREAIPGVEGLPLPGADRVLLHPDGRVTVDAPALPGDDHQRMLAVATLLRDLLSLDAPAVTGRVAVPGPLLMLLARAFGTIDLPALSFEGLCQALARFGSVAPAASSRDVGPPASATVRRMSATPVTAPTSAPPPPYRRQQDAHVAALRPEIRVRDRELFAVHTSRSGVRGVPMVIAIAIWALAVPVGALLMRGGLHLLDGDVRAVEAREIADDRPVPTKGLGPAMPARTGAAPATETPPPTAPRVDAEVRTRSRAGTGSRAGTNRGSGVNRELRPTPRASSREPRRRTAPRARKHA